MSRYLVAAPHGRHLASAIPGARLHLVPDAGHFVPEDNPAAFARAISNFLEEVDH